MEIRLFMILNIDHIYICHYTKLIDRKLFIENQLNAFGINNYEFISSYDPELLDKKLIIQKYPYIFDKTKKDNRYLRISEISLALKHCHAIEKSCIQNYDSVLILEDDAILSDNFISSYNDYLKQLPDDWDLFWVGSCCNLHIPEIKSNQNIYQTNKSRCTHCYSISKKGLGILNNIIYNIDEAIDWYYNDIINRYNLNTYWAEPSICKQNPSFNSTVQL
jgi:GR25 family glycosyltransferase involved in LPS biosynthesis